MVETLDDAVLSKDVFFKEKHFDKEWLCKEIEQLSGWLKEYVPKDSPFIFLYAKNHIKTITGFYAIKRAGYVCVRFFNCKMHLHVFEL